MSPSFWPRMVAVFRQKRKGALLLAASETAESALRYWLASVAVTTAPVRLRATRREMPFVIITEPSARIKRAEALFQFRQSSLDRLEIRQIFGRRRLFAVLNGPFAVDDKGSARAD